MKTLIKILLILLVLGGECWAATYYVSSTGSNTSPYDTALNGSTTIKPVIDYIRTNGSGSGDIVYIGSGTFSSATDYILLDNANLTGLTIFGAGSSLSIINTATANAHCISMSNGSADNITISGVKLIPHTTKSAIYKNADAGLTILSDVICESPTAHATHLARFLGDETRISNSKFNSYSDGTGTYASVQIAGDSSGYMLNSIIQPISTGTFSGSLVFTGSGVFDIKNSIIIGTDGHGISSATGTMNIYNSIVNGGFKNSASYSIYRGSGTVNTYNNLIISPWQSSNFISATVSVDSNNIKTNVSPKFLTCPKAGYVLINIDDSGSDRLSYAQNIESLLETYGYSATWFLNSSTIPIGDHDDIATMYGRDVIEIGSHGYSHTNLTYTHALNISYSGVGSNPVFSVASGSITLTCDSSVDQVIINTVTNDTIGDIVGTYGTGNVWTIAKSNTDGQSTVSISDNVLAASFQTYSSTVVPGTIDFNQTTFFTNEITSSKSAIEQIIGGDYECTSFGGTYVAGNSATKTAIDNAGFTFYRYSISGTLSGDLTNVNTLDTMAMLSIAASTFLPSGSGTSDTDTRIAARKFAFACANLGLTFCLYSHTIDEISIAQWALILDEFSNYPSIKVMSAKNFLTDIQTNWTDNEDGTYSRSVDYSNLTIQSSSPCINAGTKAGTVGLTGIQTDGFNNTWDFTPYDRLNIGADQTYSDAHTRVIKKNQAMFWP